MNPELQTLTRRVEELEAKLKTLSSNQSITLVNDRALRARFGIDTLRVRKQVPTDTGLGVRSVNESGSSSYNVAAPGDEVGLVTMDDNITYGILLYNL